MKLFSLIALAFWVMVSALVYGLMLAAAIICWSPDDPLFSVACVVVPPLIFIAVRDSMKC